MHELQPWRTLDQPINRFLCNGRIVAIYDQNAATAGAERLYRVRRRKMTDKPLAVGQGEEFA